MEQEPLKILIAEDNETDRMILQKIISRLGHVVVSAGDGMEAIELYEQETPQVVLLDVLMPRVDGLITARRLKGLAGEGRGPIMVSTSRSGAGCGAPCPRACGSAARSRPCHPA